MRRIDIPAVTRLFANECSRESPNGIGGRHPERVGLERSVSSGLAEGVAAVLAALDQSRLRIYGDALPITPGMIADLDRVAHTLKSLQSLRLENPAPQKRHQEGIADGNAERPLRAGYSNHHR